MNDIVVNALWWQRTTTVTKAEIDPFALYDTTSTRTEFYFLHRVLWAHARAKRSHGKGRTGRFFLLAYFSMCAHSCRLEHCSGAETTINVVYQRRLTTDDIVACPRARLRERRPPSPLTTMHPWVYGQRLSGTKKKRLASGGRDLVAASVDLRSKTVRRRSRQPFDCDSTDVRLPFDCSSTARRPTSRS